MAKEIVNKETGEILKGNIHPRFGTKSGLEKRKMRSMHPKCEENLTKQEFKNEADINHLMKKFQQTGILPQQVQEVQSKFADFRNLTDFHSAQNAIKKAEQAFGQLPAKMRKIWDNDPSKMMEFLSNPKNKLAAAKMGLLTREATRQVWEEEQAAKKAAAEKAATPPPVEKTTKKSSD